MERKAKVTSAIVMGASIFVVAGLVSVAAPAVADTVSAVASWPMFAGSNDTQAAPVHAAAQKVAADTVAASEKTADEAPDGAPEGYVYLGDGLTVPAGGPGDCTATSWLGGSRSGDESAYVKMLGPELVDMGPGEFAQGTVGVDAEGRIATYTVAPGDVITAIGDRFCLGNGLTLDTLNHTRMIHPGDVLLLRFDSGIADIPYFAPNDAPAGFQQAPYEAAIESMGEASTAGNVDRMRAIWANTLSAMTTNVSDREAIESALAAGDLRVLRQMFP